MADKKKNNNVAGMVFVGCIWVGLGIGFLIDKVAVGSVLGVGVGFLAMAFINYKNKNS